MNDEQQRNFWLWDAYFAVVYVAVVYLVLVEAHQATTAAIHGSFAALTVAAVLYVAMGRQRMTNNIHDGRTYLFVLLMILSLATSIWLVPLSTYVLFAVVPVIFISMRLFPAVFLVATTMFVPSIVSLVREGPTEGLFRSLLPVGAIGTAFAVLIGVWIIRVVSQNAERAELITSLEASQAEVARLSHEAGVTAERERLAGEIHDTLAQGFTSIVTLAQAALAERGGPDRHLDLMLRTARDNLAESRALVAALAPAGLTETSIVDALTRQADRLTEEGVPAALEVLGSRRPLPTGIEVVLLRTLQESLSNVRKHARASTVEIVLSYQDDSVVLLVTDDGVGFDVADGTDGFGLRGMRSRVGQVGGALSVTSTVGAGTTVELEVRA